MENKTSLVSIALCTYNGITFLKEQLDSLFNQTYQNIEIVIVDDCSTDDTFSLCDSYNLTNLRVYRNTENLGYTKNFEKAIKLCNGDFICLCDQDDIWELNKVEKLIENIEDNILVYHDSDFIGADGQKIGHDRMSTRYRMYEGCDPLPFIMANCISGHASMFSKALIPYILPFDTKFFHDWWIAYVAFNIGKVRYLDEVLVHYRQHSLTVTDNLGLKLKKPNVIKGIPLNKIWLNQCTNFKFNKDQSKIDDLFKLFQAIQEGKNRSAFFLFIARNYNDIFFFIRKKKSLLSRINYARRMAFSKTPPFVLETS